MPNSHFLLIKIPDLLIKLFATILFVLISFQADEVHALSPNWIEVDKTLIGRQSWDKNSLTNEKDGVIEIKTKYLRIDPNTSMQIEENIYEMKINCLTNKYKDISINGKSNLTAKWEDPNGDKLINEVILDSCENA